MAPSIKGQIMFHLRFCIIANHMKLYQSAKLDIFSDESNSSVIILHYSYSSVTEELNGSASA